MSDSHLDKVLPFLNNIDAARRKQFYDYFRNAPLWLIESFRIEKIPNGKIFVREGEPVDVIYFIGDGIIKATDYRIFGIKFDFILFTKVYALGAMEVNMDINEFCASLETVTDCIVLKIPKSEFARWMKTDISALRHETKLMGEYLLEQAKRTRAFLFLQGADRLALLFKNRYKKFAVNGVLKIENDRQELSDFTGLSLKTITRSIKKMEEDGLLTKQGNRILINKAQYNRIKEQLAEILDEEE